MNKFNNVHPYVFFKNCKHSDWTITQIWYHSRSNQCIVNS